MRYIHQFLQTNSRDKVGDIIENTNLPNSAVCDNVRMETKWATYYVLSKFNIQGPAGPRNVRSLAWELHTIWRERLDLQ